MLRAIRLEQRFGFVLHRHTLRLLGRAVDKGWLDLLSGARLWREVRFMLEGESPVACLKRLDELGILAHIDAALTLPPERLSLLTRVAEARVELAETHADVIGRAWPVYLAALVSGLEMIILRRAGSRLALAPRTIQELCEALAAVERAFQRLCSPDDVRPSEVASVLHRLPLEMLPLLLALCPGREVHQHVQRYLTTWRYVRPHLTGDDLKRLGVPQGPQIGRLLARVQAARLDGEVLSREAEEALVRRACAEAPAL
jgi:tRNA nucleotidyltransferase (CCA-adding enzyme)